MFLFVICIMRLVMCVWIGTNNKKKHEKSALEATILELNIKKSKIEASILAIFTDGSSGGSTISSLEGNSQSGNAFGGRA